MINSFLILLASLHVDYFFSLMSLLRILSGINGLANSSLLRLDGVPPDYDNALLSLVWSFSPNFFYPYGSCCYNLYLLFDCAGAGDLNDSERLWVSSAYFLFGDVSIFVYCLLSFSFLSVLVKEAEEVRQRFFASDYVVT